MKEGKAYIGDKIVEGNKIICEFMGGKKFMAVWYYVGPDGFEHESGTHLKYHSSWDWLKPVIDEIFTYALAHHEQVKEIRDISIVVEIGACWGKVVQFIKWYNENKQS